MISPGEAACIVFYGPKDWAQLSNVEKSEAIDKMGKARYAYDAAFRDHIRHHISAIDDLLPRDVADDALPSLREMTDIVNSSDDQTYLRDAMSETALMTAWADAVAGELGGDDDINAILRTEKGTTK